METSRSTLTIDDFQIIRTIGTGTFGRVKLVKLRGNEKMPPFALKILRKKLIVRYKQVDHVRSERETLSKISKLPHPFIVNFFLTFQDETFIYFLFEYICGGELFSFLRQQIRFPLDTVKFYACQMVLAIEFLHSKDIVYRDIKPENILIDRKGNLKLTDFGFAKVLTGKTHTMCGTPEYMAPEVIMKGAGYDFNADWWSFGVFLFEMIEGKAPFFDEHPIQIYQRILTGKYSFTHCTSRKLRGLISKLLVESGKRIGRKNGVKDIKNHGFFDKINWNDVISKAILAPWVPAIESRDDTHYFHEYCDTEDGVASVTGSVDLNVLFQGF